MNHALKMKMYHQFQVFHWKSDDQQMGFAAVSTSARAPLHFALARHDLIDRRSLELNRLVAEKIRRQPELMDLVRNRLERTLSESPLSESSKDALREWQTILSTHSFKRGAGNSDRRLRSGPAFAPIKPFFGHFESAGTF